MMTFHMTPRSRTLSPGYRTSDRIARNVGASDSEVHVPLDVKEAAEAYEITVTLPGLEADDLDIEIVENIVEIRGEFERRSEEDDRYLRRERPVGKFHRVLRFSTKLESDEAEAALQNGILTLRVPKVAEARPKNIKVKSQ